MPVLDPDVIDDYVYDEIFTARLDNLLKEKQEISNEFGQDFFANYLKNEYGILSLLRRTGMEPSFMLAIGRYGADAEALGNNIQSIEIKSKAYNVKTWKLPDIINNSSFAVCFDKIRQGGSIEKIKAYDGYAFGIFTENLDRPEWVTIHTFEPTILLWIKKKSGVKKVSNMLLDKISKKLKKLAKDKTPHDTTYGNNTVQPSFQEVYNLLTDKELNLIVNGVSLTKKEYAKALEMGDEFWWKKQYKKGPRTK